MKAKNVFLCVAFGLFSAGAIAHDQCKFYFASHGPCVQCHDSSDYGYEMFIDLCWMCDQDCIIWSRDAQGNAISTNPSASTPVQKNAKTKRSEVKFEGSFINMSDVMSIGQINPIAAMIALRFVPEYYRPTAFHRGDMGGARIPTMATLIAATTPSDSEDALLKTTRPTPEGLFMKTQWQLIEGDGSSNPIWKIESIFQNSDGTHKGVVYPSIEMQLSRTEPYRVIGWSAK